MEIDHGELDGELLRDRDSYRDFFALLSSVMLDDELRERIAQLYAGHRELYEEVLRSAGDLATTMSHRWPR